MEKDDRLPNVICVRCSDHLDLLFKFKEIATKSEDILNNFILYAEKLKGSEEVGNNNNIKSNNSRKKT